MMLLKVKLELLLMILLLFDVADYKVITIFASSITNRIVLIIWSALSIIKRRKQFMEKLVDGLLAYLAKASKEQ